MTRTTAKVTKRNMICSAMLICLAGAVTRPAFAAGESETVRAIYLSAANVPTNIAGINTYPEPPKSFNPLTASDVELATYGFPQRPDKQVDANHYAMWERAMLAARIRSNGKLRPAPTNGHVMEPVGAASSLPAEPQAAQPLVATQGHNDTAAGVILNNNVKKWSSASFSDIWSVITVPVVETAFAAGCTDAWYYSQSLVGFDPILFYSAATGHPLYYPQEFAGVSENIYCPTGAQSYDAVIGWGGFGTIVFSLNPGDVFYTEVHAFGGCNNGSAFVEDLTTLTFNSYTISNPCGVLQTGRYANWVVIRPLAGNGIDGESPLANTISISFDGAQVNNVSGKPFYPGSQATTTSVLTMYDDTNSQAIELVNQGATGFQGLHSLFFQTTGCAYAGGCTP
jgi:hypothetical protein